MLFPVFLTLGVAALSMALRSYHHVVPQKLGALGVMATSFLIGYFVSGYVAIGAACALSWLFLPWLEILTRVRNLRLPMEKNLRHRAPPSEDLFPALGGITEEIEGEGFSHVDDAGWDWDDCQQFYRLFYKPEDRSQSAICLIDQSDMAFYYLSISSRTRDGRTWTTWNYPFSYSLKLQPNHRINRLSSSQTFLQLEESHREFLRKNLVTADQLAEVNPDEIQHEIQKDIREQIAHNIANGVLTEAGEGQIRYSWRGLFFIWCQFLRDLVRWS